MQALCNLFVIMLVMSCAARKSSSSEPGGMGGEHTAGQAEHLTPEEKARLNKEHHAPVTKQTMHQIQHDAKQRGERAIESYKSDVTWNEVRAKRQHFLDSYIERNHEDYQWFMNWQFGYGGSVPYIILRLLPEVVPDIFGDWENKVGLMKNTTRPDSKLPLGLTHSTAAPNSVLFVRKLQVAAFSCASCHAGRVLDDQGHEHLLVGAPNTTWDPFRYKALLVDAVKDPRYTPENFLKVWKTKDWEWLYGKSSYGLYQVGFFSTSFLAKIVLDGLKNALLGTPEAPVNTYMLDNIYKDDPERFNGGNPGQAEIMSLVLNLVDTKTVDSLHGEERMAYLNRYLPPGPTIVDFMHVYRQALVPTGQWDGNTPDPLLRNLGAEAAAMGSVLDLDFKNAKRTTRFVAHLPPPPYIFDVDMSKAKYGEKIFYDTCARCHAEGRFIPLSEVKTDKYRAVALKEDSIKLLATGLKAACTEPHHPSCKIPPEDIIVDRTKNPGYIAHRLDGIWTRAPYMHNGSIPTLYHVLVPDERPKSFFRGNLEYDKEKVGFVWDREINKYGRTYDTRKVGNSNAGHGLEEPSRFFGTYNFKEDAEAREALIEYLKTL